jgi:phage recombination protein Bet
MKDTQLQEAKPLFKPSALATMASRFNVDPAKLHSTLKNTVFKGASDDELLALVVVANEYGLNPLTKEIYAFPAKGGGIVPVVSVDGWNNLANSHPQMDGIEFDDRHDDAGRLVAITCIIHRKDRSKPIKVTEYLSECRRNTEPWKMEHRMLRHKALIQCVRVAFGFSGVYDEDDARTVAAKVYDVPAAAVPNNSPSETGAAGLGGSAVSHDTAPAGVTRSRQTKSGVKDSAPLVLDGDAPTLREQVAGKMKVAALEWSQVATAADQGGLFVDPSLPLADTPDDVLRDVLAAWDNLAPLAKEVTQ